MGKAKRRAMTLGIYIRLLGAKPLVFEHTDYRAYELAIEAQFAKLREAVGEEASRAAQKTGDSLILQTGLIIASQLIIAAQGSQLESSDPSDKLTIEASASELSRLPDASADSNAVEHHDSPEPSTRQQWNCRRKVRHSKFLNALKHALILHDSGIAIYDCAACGGIHVGHENPMLARNATENRQRLRDVEQSLADLDRKRAELRREQRALEDRNASWTLLSSLTSFLWLRVLSRILLHQQSMQRHSSLKYSARDTVANDR